MLPGWIAPVLMTMGCYLSCLHATALKVPPVRPPSQDTSVRTRDEKMREPPQKKKRLQNTRCAALSIDRIVAAKRGETTAGGQQVNKQSGCFATQRAPQAALQDPS
mmetsp:Transcript_2424/g.7040  ORF Transcript_2424/g.7040 Transcript_2424/m.7040 type:complete len:106 (+) Transcript_2424:3091-3408(+)